MQSLDGRDSEDTAGEGEAGRDAADKASSDAAKREEDSWADEPIVGLCVARNGNLFVTMTKSSIALWQTKVRESPFGSHIKYVLLTHAA